MMVIRKKLTASEISPSNQRYNADCDCVQYSADGVTWVDAPQFDPRTSPQFQVPPVSSETPRCDAAASIVGNFKDGLTGALSTLSGVATAAGGASFLLNFLDFLDGIGVLFQLLIDFASLILSLGVDLVGAGFTDAVYDNLKCILECCASGDGTFTQQDINHVETLVRNTYGETNAVTLVFNAWVENLGVVGMNNVASLKHVTGDCSACATCSYEIECVGDDLHNGFVSENDGGAPNYAQGYWDETIPGWQVGIGTSNRPAYWIAAYFTVPPQSTFTAWEMYFNPSGANTDNVIKQMYCEVNGSVVVNQTGTTFTPSPYAATLPTPATAGDTVRIICSINGGGGYRTDLPLYRVNVFGTGAPPLAGVPF